MPTPCRSCRPRVALARPRCLHGRHLAHARDVKSPSLPLLSPSTLSLSLSPSLLLLALQPAPCRSPWPAAAELRPHRSCYRPLLLRPSHHHYQRRHPILRPACRFFELQRHRPQLSSWPQPRPAVLMWPSHYGPPRAEPRLPTGARGTPSAPPPLHRRRQASSGRPWRTPTPPLL